MTKVIVFDFADTIARLHPTKEFLVQSFIKEKLNYDIPLKRIEETYFYMQNLYFYSSVNTITGTEKKDFYLKYNRKIFSNLGVLHGIEPYLEEFYRYFSQYKKHWVLKQGVVKLFEEIQSKGYEIGLISNFDSVLIDILDNELKIKQYFSYIHISQDIGVEKPNKDFYKTFLTTYALQAQDIVYVGDNYELDFVPSVSLGFKSILLDEGKYYKHLKGVVPSITNILDIKDLL